MAKKHSFPCRLLSVCLSVLMVVAMIPAITIANRDGNTAKAYGTYSKQKSTEYYYASGTQFIASGILYYDSDSNSDATNWLSNNGWTPLGVNFNAGDGKDSKYIHYGVKYTTNPVGAITGYAVRDSSDRPDSYTGKTYNGTSVTWYKVGSGAAGITPTGGDGVVDLNKGGGGNDLTLYATNAYECGPAVTSATHYQGGNGESTRNNLLNGGYTPAQDQNGNWQDCNEGCGGDFVYWAYKSSCTTVNSDNLRTAYNYAKYLYENGGSGTSGLASALTNAENTLSDLNDGYTTRSQSTIDSYTRALYDAVPTISVNTEYNASIGTANMQRYYKFTPSATGTYVFYSYGSGDTQGYIYNKTTSGTGIGSSVISNDDGPNYYRTTLGLAGTQFYMTANLTANTTYYFMVRFYSTNTGTVKFKVANARNITFNTTGGATNTTLTLPQGHTFTLSNARTTGNAAFTRDGHTLLAWSTTGTGAEAKTYMNTDSIAVPDTSTTYYALWNPTSPTTLSVNTDYTATISAGSQIVYYQFTPSKTKKYLFYGLSTTDTYGLLYNAGTYASNASYSATSDDNGKTDFGQSSNQFHFAQELTAGTKYLFGVKYYNTGTGSIPFRFEEVYNVTYNANGGSGAPAAQEKYYNKAIALSSTTPTRTGYTFQGWATSSTATTASYQASASYSSNADLALYAVWKANTYGVTLDNQSATTAGTTAVTATYDSAMPSATMPAKTGYTFGGYYDGTNGSGTQYYTAAGASARTWNKTAATTLYAKWTINSYTITFKAADGTVLKTQTVNYGVTPTAPAIPAKAADATYHYTGAWDNTVAAASANTTYTVVYTALPHSGGTANCVDKAVCTNCGTAYGNVNANNHKNVVNDEAVAPSCTETGLTAGKHCSACEAVITAQTTINANGHKMTKTAAKAATCLATGNNEYYTCDTCKKVFKDADGATETTVAAETLAKLAHSYTGDVKDNENGTHSFKCVNGCNEYGGTADCEYDSDVKTPATCTEKGTTTYTCKTCSYTYDAQDIAALGHSMTKTAAKAATCTENGNNEYYTCDTCNKVFKDADGATETTAAAEVLTALGHSMTKTAAKAATCLATGNNEYYTCDTCKKVFKDANGATETTVGAETLAKLAHSYTVDVKDNENGTHSFKCVNGCNEYGGTADCEYDSDVKTPATCTEKGTTTYTCKTCSYTYDAQDIAALGHSMTKTAAKAATCTEAGNNEYYTCGTCNKVFKDADGATETTAAAEVLTALGHSMTKTAAKAATCTEAGNNEYYTCGTCNKVFKDANGATETTVTAETLAMIAHTYDKTAANDTYKASDATCIAKATYYYSCVCGAKGTATFENGEFAAHSPEYVTAENPTCTAPGHIAYYQCAVCKKNFTDNTCATELTNMLSNHTLGGLVVEVPATCSKTGVKAHYECSLCGAFFDENYAPLADITIAVDPDNHAYDEWTTVTGPTCSAKGTKQRVCSYNNNHIETGEIEINPDNHSYGEWVTVTAATCTAKGSKQRVCVYNKDHIDTAEIEINPDNHSYGEWVTVTEPTCTAKGTKQRVCTYDKNHIDTGDIEINPDNHAYGEWVTVTEPTCTAKGTKQRVCTYNKNHIDTGDIEINPDNHAYGEWVTVTAPTCTNKGTEKRVCAYDGSHFETRDTETVPDAHKAASPVSENIVPATCTRKGSFDSVVYCELCAKELSREKQELIVDSDAHTPANSVVEILKIDDNHEQGYTVVYCADCGEELSRNLFGDAQYCCPACHMREISQQLGENSIPGRIVTLLHKVLHAFFKLFDSIILGI